MGFSVIRAESSQRKPPRITGRYASIVSRIMTAAPAESDIRDFAVPAPAVWDMLQNVWGAGTKDKSVTVGLNPIR
jgi:hypothetical protein